MKLNLLSMLSVLISFIIMGCDNDGEKTPQGGELTVADYGAVADGITDNTAALQAALDDCSKQNATLIVPAGTYLTGPLFMKSNTTLKLEANAVLLGTDDMEVYAAAFYPAVYGSSANEGVYTPALLYASGANNITVTGEGTLDGQGGAPGFPQVNNERRRPKLIFMVDCRNVTVENIKLLNSAFWSSHYLRCDGVTIRNLNIYGHSNWNSDGIDIDSKNVLVENCVIDVDDDGICLKSDTYSVCENVVVKDCIIKTNCNAIKFGTSSYGGFKNVDISRCTVSKASEDNVRHWQTAHAWANVRQPVSALSGIAVESVDGGILEDVTISDITISDAMAPVFIRLGDRHKTYSSGRVSVLKNVTIQNITAAGVSSLAGSITAVEGSYAENVVIKNVSLTVPGGGTSASMSVLVPENRDAYPEATMFRTVLPAYGFYVRHVQGIRFENVTVNKTDDDARPMFFYDDVIGATLINSRPAGITDNLFLRQRNCSNIQVDGNAYEGGIVGGDSNDPNQGSFTVGANTYTTYNYDGVVWMVTNSKEGTATGTQYTGHAAGENGYYYNSDDKVTACPSGWRLPTVAEATALANLINADLTADNVRWWVNGGDGAFAGIKSGSNPGTYMYWGTQGTWRIGNGRIATPNDNTWTYSTLSSYTTRTPQMQAEDSVDDHLSNRIRWYSVRCVQE